jgi:DNA mismatch endonuclease Vsr
MSRIRGKNTTPEKAVRSLLHRMGYRFRLHVRIPIPVTLSASIEERAGERCRPRRNSAKAVPPLGTLKRNEDNSPLDTRLSTQHQRFIRPDILLPKHKTAIFVHGCFWHRHKGCKNCTTPTNRREWWLAKLNGNAARDKLHQAALKRLGWKVIVIWECEIKKPSGDERLLAKLPDLNEHTGTG